MSSRGDGASLTSGTAWLGRAFQPYEEVTSSSDVLWEWARAEGASRAPHGAVVLARRQTAGRGRQGRAWKSVDGNLHTTWLLRPALATQRLAALPLVVGMAVRDLLVLDFSLPDVQLKWPNDVLVAGRKMAGILVESREGAYAVGLGLNLVVPAAGWRELDARAVAASELGVRRTELEALGSLLERAEPRLDRFFQEGFDPMLAEYESMALPSAGQSIRLARPDQPPENATAVVARGFNPDGALRVQRADGQAESVYGSEVHLTGEWV